MKFKEKPPLFYGDVVSVVRGTSLVENQMGFATRYMNIFHLKKGYWGTASIGHAYGVGGRKVTRVRTS